MKFQELRFLYSSIIAKYLGSIEKEDILKFFLELNLLILINYASSDYSESLIFVIFLKIQTLAIDFPKNSKQKIRNSTVESARIEKFSTTLLCLFESAQREKKIDINRKYMIIKKDMG